jgi:hypothetical protein
MYVCTVHTACLLQIPNKIISSSDSERSKKIFIRILEQDFAPCCMVFKGQKETEKQIPSQCFYEQNKNTKNSCGVASYSQIFFFLGVTWNTLPAKSEAQIQ